MTIIEKQLRRKYVRTLVRRVRILTEMRQNAFQVRKELRHAFRTRHRAMV